MDTAMLVAKLYGPVCLLVGLAVLMRPKFLDRLMADFYKSEALMYIGGIMAFVVGLLLVNYHNVWVKDWTVLVTIIGWAALLKGVLILLSPDHLKELSKKMMAPDMQWLMYLIMFGLGGWFTYVGYLM